MTNLKKTLLCSLLTMLASQASAHSTWLANRIGEPTIIYGHGPSDDDYNPEKVTIVKGFDINGNVKAIEKKAHEKNVSLVLPEGVAYIGFVLDNGYWAKNKDGKWENKPKNEVEGATTGGHYVKNAIALIHQDAVVKPVSGLTLQIIPLENPLTKKAGDDLTVQVLLDGKPLEGAAVTNDYVNMGHVRSKTDADGKITLTIRNQGLNVIGAGYTEKLENDPKADKNGYESTLSFTLESFDED